MAAPNWKLYLGRMLGQWVRKMRLCNQLYNPTVCTQVTFMCSMDKHVIVNGKIKLN